MRQGIILTGREGDDVKRPSWALDGSFLVFRYLSQLVPEFDAFKKEKAKTLGLDEELLGARLMGRWKSGMYFFDLALKGCTDLYSFHRCTHQRLPLQR